MLFKELIEQHRVHHFIADGVRLALLVASDQSFLDLAAEIRVKSFLFS